MAFKFVALLALVAVANAGLVQHAPVTYAAAPSAVVHHAAPVGYAAAPVAYSSAPVAYAAAPAYVKAAPVAVAHAQPILAKAAEEYDPHPQYKFAYDVQDSLSGDSKSQSETRDGDVVHGEYSLIDADGYKRTVQYTADPINGFNAVVNREPLGHVVKAVAAAPVIKAAPVAYSAAPVLKAAYAAPTLVKSAPVAYASAPVAYASAPVHYAAPAHHVAYSAPAYTYAH